MNVYCFRKVNEILYFFQKWCYTLHWQLLMLILKMVNRYDMTVTDNQVLSYYWNYNISIMSLERSLWVRWFKPNMFGAITGVCILLGIFLGELTGYVRWVV